MRHEDAWQRLPDLLDDRDDPDLLGHVRGCADCHGPERWKPPSRFDHDKTAFPLVGRHEKTPCAS